MLGVNDALEISNWIEGNLQDLNNFEEDTFIPLLMTLYNKIIVDKNIQNIPLEVLYKIINCWLSTKSFIEIQEELSDVFNIKIEILEKICNNSLSYSMSFLIGNIIDLSNEGDLEEKSKKMLAFLQKRFKYGLKDLTSISIYESGIQDRIIATQIAGFFADYNIDNKQIQKKIKENQENIKTILVNYPSCFSSILEQIIN